MTCDCRIDRNGTVTDFVALKLLLDCPPERSSWMCGSDIRSGLSQGGGGTWIPYIGLGGGGLPEALNFFVTLSDKYHSNGLQHYQSTLEA